MRYVCEYCQDYRKKIKIANGEKSSVWGILNKDRGTYIGMLDETFAEFNIVFLNPVFSSIEIK